MGPTGMRMGLHNEEIRSLYLSRNTMRTIKSRKVRLVDTVARMEESRSAFKILTGKALGKRPSGRPRRRWEDNIRMNLKEIGINTIWPRIIGVLEIL